MTTVQEWILIWRYSNSVPKFLIGFFLKALIEAGLAIGGIVALFILGVTAFFDISFSAFIPYSIPRTDSRVLTWVILTGWLWTRLRCIMAEGVLPEAIRMEVESEEESREDSPA